MVQDDLKWDLNTSTIVKKANARMKLLRRVASFGTPAEVLKTVYILFVRSPLEQSAAVASVKKIFKIWREYRRLPLKLFFRNNIRDINKA